MTVMEHNTENRKTNKAVGFPQWPMPAGREIELVTEVVRSGKWWRMSGTMVTEFEKNLQIIMMQSFVWE